MLDPSKFTLMLHRKSGDPIPQLLDNGGQLSGRSFELVHGAELILEACADLLRAGGDFTGRDGDMAHHSRFMQEDSFVRRFPHHLDRLNSI